jgi:type VI secretion system secreted protein VgrG
MGLSNLASSAFANLSGYTDDNRLFSAQFGSDCPITDADSLVPQYVTGEEGINRHLSYKVVFISTNLEIPESNLIGYSLGINLQTDGADSRHINGIIEKVESGPIYNGQRLYSVWITDGLKLMSHRKIQRVFVEKSTNQIIKTLFDEVIAHSQVFQACFQYEFRVPETPVRAFFMQTTSDEECISYLTALHGWNWHIEPVANDNYAIHKIVIWSDNYGLDESPASPVSFHDGGSTMDYDGISEWGSGRQIVSGSVRRTSPDYKSRSRTHSFSESVVSQGEAGNSLQGALEYYQADVAQMATSQQEFDGMTLNIMRHFEMRSKLFHAVGNERNAAAGQWFKFDGHTSLQNAKTEQNQFIILSLSLSACNNFGKDNAELANVHHELLGRSDKNNQDPRKAVFQCSMELVRRMIPVVPEPPKPIEISGFLRGTIVGKPNSVVDIDTMSRQKVMFDFAVRLYQPEGGASGNDMDGPYIPVMTVGAGSGRGLSLYLRNGDLCIVSFERGNPSKPLIIGSIYNGSAASTNFSNTHSLPGDAAVGGLRQTEFNGFGATQLLIDSTQGQIGARLQTTASSSQVNIGDLRGPRSNGAAVPLGSGIGMVTDAHIAIRAAMGIFISTYGRMQASGKQLSREELIQLLDESYHNMTGFGDYAAENQGLPLDPKPHKAFQETIKNLENGSNTAPNAPRVDAAPLAMASPGGIGMVAPQGIISHAGTNSDHTAQQNMQLTAGNLFNVNAGKGIGHFAHQGGVKSIAHHGDHVTQAQHDNIVMDAAKNIHMTAKNIYLHADNIYSVATDGSYTKIGGGLEVGSNSPFNVKAAGLNLKGPATMADQSPTFKDGKPDQKFVLKHDAGFVGMEEIVPHQAYEIIKKDGSIIKGVSDADGKTSLLEHEKMQIAQIILKQKHE